MTTTIANLDDDRRKWVVDLVASILNDVGSLSAEEERFLVMVERVRDGDEDFDVLPRWVNEHGNFAELDAQLERDIARGLS